MHEFAFSPSCDLLPVFLTLVKDTCLHPSTFQMSHFTFFFVPLWPLEHCSIFGKYILYCFFAVVVNLAKVIICLCTDYFNVLPGNYLLTSHQGSTVRVTIPLFIGLQRSLFSSCTFDAVVCPQNAVGLISSLYTSLAVFPLISTTQSP